tara:strand:- start:281 stop:568 length:288 start_codon:yes stop_codon:yes gene_type:complete
LKPDTKQKRKIGQTHKLAKLALIDKPVSRPAKGKVYLKDIPVGSLFRTDTLKGILIDISISSATVVITQRYTNDKDDSFYLGKRLIAPDTEVNKL